MAQNIIGGLLLSIIGLLLVVDPHGVWKISEHWKQIGAAAASPAFLIVTRIVGAVTLLIGMLVCLGILK